MMIFSLNVSRDKSLEPPWLYPSYRDIDVLSNIKEQKREMPKKKTTDLSRAG